MYAEKDEKFGNARAMENMFQILTNIQASRLASEIYRGATAADRIPSPEQLSLLSARDCEKAVNSNIINCSFTENKTIGFAV